MIKCSRCNSENLSSIMIGTGAGASVIETYKLFCTGCSGDIMVVADSESDNIITTVLTWTQKRFWEPNPIGGGYPKGCCGG